MVLCVLSLPVVWVAHWECNVLHKILPLRRLERAVLLLLSVCLSVSLVFFFLLDSLVLPLLCIVTDTKRRVAQYVRPAKPLPQFPTFRFGKHKLDTDTAHSVPFLTAPVALFYSFLAFANSSLFHLSGRRRSPFSGVRHRLSSRRCGSSPFGCSRLCRPACG